MAKKKRQRGHPKAFAFERLYRACHECGMPIEAGTVYCPIYGHVYHVPCWNAVWRQGGGR